MICSSRRSLRPILVLFCALGLASLALVESAAAAEDKPTPRLMSLTGQVQVTTSPDMAILSLGVVSEDRTARQALIEKNPRKTYPRSFGP